MPKKLNLNLDDLKVESFEMAAESGNRGTVEGATGPFIFESCLWGGTCCGEVGPTDVCDQIHTDSYCCATMFQTCATYDPCGRTIQGSCETVTDPQCYSCGFASCTCQAGCIGGGETECEGCTTAGEVCIICDTNVGCSN